jgi:hypothetical protein
VKLYRIFHYDADAKPHDRGGALFIPPQGSGRVDNPNAYEVTYLADSEAGACAEVFNRGKYRVQWSNEMLRPPRFAPTTVRAIAVFDVAEDLPICDLYDPTELTRQALRPSRVITRDYAISQAWALRIFQSGAWHGLKWWSYHDARWSSVGIWDQGSLEHYNIEILTIDRPTLADAATVLSIPIVI